MLVLGGDEQELSARPPVAAHPSRRAERLAASLDRFLGQLGRADPGQAGSVASAVAARAALTVAAAEEAPGRPADRASGRVTDALADPADRLARALADSADRLTGGLANLTGGLADAPTPTASPTSAPDAPA